MSDALVTGSTTNAGLEESERFPSGRRRKPSVGALRANIRADAKHGG